jgi:hypothetical protein
MHKGDTIRPWARLGAALALIAVVLATGGQSAWAQGGVPAPTGPCPAVYPGDEAAGERIARWMARGAADRGLPLELPVMAGIAESGLRNLKGESYAGFFGMHRSLNHGEYRGFRRNPQLQLDWFLDSAGLVRQRRVAEGRPDPAGDDGAYGTWIADVERPAPENRAGYQPHLDQARELIAGKCDPPASDDTTGPRLRVRIARPQHPLTTGGVLAYVRCPDQDCLAGATIAIGGRARHAAATEPSAEGFTVLTVPLPRASRRALREGAKLRAVVRVTAADAAANTTTRRRAVTLME